MSVIETNTHSFIIRMWTEEDAASPSKKLWRGHITHVPSHAQFYFNHLEQLCRFFNFYSAEIDIDDQPESLAALLTKWKAETEK